MTTLEQEHRGAHWGSLYDYIQGFHAGQAHLIYSDLLDDNMLLEFSYDYHRGFREGFERAKEGEGKGCLGIIK